MAGTRHAQETEWKDGQEGRRATLGKFKLTARTDAPDFRDFSYRPALVTLKPRLPVPANLNIRNQGDSSACTAFAIVGYDDQGFWIQNSWGQAWGRKGPARRAGDGQRDARRLR